MVAHMERRARAFPLREPPVRRPLPVYFTMRPLRRLSLLVTLAACSAGGGTDPNDAVLRVRLVDDRGMSAGRHQVVVQPTVGATVERVTGTDGRVSIGVASSGIYRVRVIPRDGWMSTPALTRTVTLVSTEQAVVDFTLLRAGVSTGDVPR